MLCHYRPWLIPGAQGVGAGAHGRVRAAASDQHLLAPVPSVRPLTYAHCWPRGLLAGSAHRRGMEVRNVACRRALEFGTPASARACAATAAPGEHTPRSRAQGFPRKIAALRKAGSSRRLSGMVPRIAGVLCPAPISLPKPADGHQGKHAIQALQLRDLCSCVAVLLIGAARSGWPCASSPRRRPPLCGPLPSGSPSTLRGATRRRQAQRLKLRCASPGCLPTSGASTGPRGVRASSVGLASSNDTGSRPSARGPRALGLYTGSGNSTDPDLKGSASWRAFRRRHQGLVYGARFNGITADRE